MFRDLLFRSNNHFLRDPAICYLNIEAFRLVNRTHLYAHHITYKLVQKIFLGVLLALELRHQSDFAAVGWLPFRGSNKRIR